ncbi:MAG: type I 3-dehydroquinate dehydratase, partial [Simkaniaceae bacterium]|nr:type I 3-dehydroquinate dehydratase [Simkaniaceae bacterium]
MFKVMVLLNSEVPLTQGDMYEFRLDAFPSIELDQIKTLMKGRRVIFTYPGASENMIRSLLDLEPEYIDLDYRTPLPFVAEVRKRCKVICSYHNFHETPLDLEKLPLFEADEQKVATMAHSTLDALRMLHYVKGKSHFTGICMGEEGKITRQLAPLIGSTFNFIPVGAPSAPGQLSLQELYPCNRDTQIYGLIGDPVTFSPSHYTHNQVFKAFNLNSIYVKMSVKEGELKSFFELIDTLPFQGLSVTIPHKEKVLPGAIVNTLKKIKGEWQGRNTDGIGAIQAIEKRMPIQGKELLFIGAGGAAKGVMQEASQRGARVKFYNRSIQKNEFRQIFDREPYDILINTTPVYEEIPINPHWIEEGKLVFDMITLPRETALIHYAKKKGCPVIYGEEMFVYQAAEQFKWWFDGALDEDKVI